MTVLVKPHFAVKNILECLLASSDQQKSTEPQFKRNSSNGTHNSTISTMRLVKNTINTITGTGSATLIPQEPEDMWHLYNLIRPYDVLRAPAVRKVKETAQSTGSSISRTVRTTLTIRVKDLDFDPQAGELHVAGRVCEENDYVKMGQYHTLDLELQRQFVLEKGREDAGAAGGSAAAGGGEGWDSVALGMLSEATDLRKNAAFYAVVMEEGSGNVCLMTEHQTVLRQRVELAMPRKRTGHGADAHDKAVDRFFDLLLVALRRHLDIEAVTAADQQNTPPLVLASPGFIAQGFHKFMLATATRTGDKTLGAYARNNVVIAHSSSGHLHSLHEALKSPAVMAKLSDTRFARETALIDKFTELLRQDEGRAWYGPQEVERAVEKGAVGRGGGVLLISNALFRSLDVSVRRRWVALVERVRDVEGGEVRILSSAHESGKKLEGLGNVGAILTFPLLDLDEDEDDEEEPPPIVNGNGVGADHTS